MDLQAKNKAGRPPINKELDSLIVRLAKLRKHNILPAPVRGGSVSWRHLMAHYKQQILATDFLNVETIRLQTLYVLFFIELGSRRVHISGVIPNPNALWATQQARQLV